MGVWVAQEGGERMVAEDGAEIVVPHVAHVSGWVVDADAGCDRAVGVDERAGAPDRRQLAAALAEGAGAAYQR